jgi:hydrogenase maturation protein HypF
LGEAVAHFERFLGVEPELVAHDLHPDYLSTRFALEQPGVHVAVQHHHAHLASAAAEHGFGGSGLERDVLAVIFDGTGYGTDGTAWGGEFLYGGFHSYRRIATFRPLALAGGDLAMREVWRLALALLDDSLEGCAFEDGGVAGAFPVERLALFAPLGRRGVGRRVVGRRTVELVRRQIASGVAVTKARGVGRLFDAVGALALSRPVARYESEVALLLGDLARDVGVSPYPLRIDWTKDPWSKEPLNREPWEIDPRPLVRAVAADCLSAASPRLISERFHAALCAVTVEILAAAAERLDRPPVVLSGGCFANPILTSGIRARLARSAAADLPLYVQRQAPPGDGGIALGQVMVADAVTRARSPSAPSTLLSSTGELSKNGELSNNGEASCV